MAEEYETETPILEISDSALEKLHSYLVQAWRNSMYLDGEETSSTEASTQEEVRRRHRQHCRFLYGASWRWTRALREASRTGIRRHVDDDACQLITDFLTIEVGGQIDSDTAPDDFNKWSQCFRHARAVYGNPIDRLIVEALVLAGLPITEIATETGCGADVLAIYESAFFDARVMLGARQAIMCLAIDFGVNADKDPMRAELLRVSYFGGRIAALGVVDYLRHCHEDHDLATEAGIRRRQFELQIRSRQLLVKPLPVSPATSALLRSTTKEWLSLPTVADLVQRRLYRCDIALPLVIDEETGSNKSHTFVAEAVTARKSA